MEGKEQPMSTTTTAIHVPSDLTAGYDALAKATGRSRDALMNEALQEYLAREAEDLARLERAISMADRGEFASEEEMESLYAEFAGTPEERAALRKELDASLRTAYGLPACE
jgi:RHH-type rel operon transcriptional repressor/antitoxin RelB